MTVNLRVLQKDIIIVAADSGITNTGTRAIGPNTTRFTEYIAIPERKFRVFDGVCVVTMWGQLPACNALLDELKTCDIDPTTHTVDDVAAKAFQYLRNDYRPHELFQNDDGIFPVGEDFKDHTGYHVCGFTPDKKPKCYNIFWGTDIPPKTSHQLPKYESYPKPYQEQPLRSTTEWVYTGRPDLAGGIIQTLLREIKHGLDIRYDMGTITGKVQIVDMVMRFASEITPQVESPFHIAVITPDNLIRVITNPGLSPIDPTRIYFS